MLEEHNKRDKAHLTNLIRTRSNNTPNFSLLIGGGASATSGVKTASQMIAEWRKQLYHQSKNSEPFEEWLQKQDWHEDDEEYSILFEMVCDQRSSRRIYIEECVKHAKPSWGYIYLANIIAHNYFNVIFTPNFDDLLNEACFLYADLRPIVSAHDSAVADIRITSARPKIIKLHGDFLYDSIKNTVSETESLEKNMRDKFLQFGREYGLVVIGYGGNDRSIMDILDTMLRTEGYFPGGLYWCMRKGGKVSRKLDRLMRRENAYWVEIEGFDEFMAELHEGLGLTLPDAVRDPYKATTEKLNRFILPSEEAKHLVIKSDIEELQEQVKRFEKVITATVPTSEFDRFVPYLFLGDREFERREYRGALAYYEKAVFQKVDDLGMMGRMVLCFQYTEDFEKALDRSNAMIEQDPSDYRGYFMRISSLHYLDRIEDAIESGGEALKHVPGKKERLAVLISRSNVLLVASKWEAALSDAEEALRIDSSSAAALINKCIALKELGRQDESKKILEKALSEFKGAYQRAGSLAILGAKEDMLKELRNAIGQDNAYKVRARFDPDFAGYRNDPDFRKLVYGDKPKKPSAIR